MTYLRPGRIIRPLAGGLGAVLLLSACMGGTKDSGKDAAAGYDPKATVEITWWTGQPQEQEKVAEQLAAEYHTAHPNVTVKGGPQSWDEMFIGYFTYTQAPTTETAPVSAKEKVSSR